jgi:hypothetical protein
LLVLATPVEENRSEILRIAVASDLHAYDNCGRRPEPSHLKISHPEDQPGKHPIAGLIKLIKDGKLAADLLLCPGDLGDQAEVVGIQYAWKKLHQLGSDLGAGLVTATAGNHDLNSRYIKGSFDPKETLQALDPPFPLPDETHNDMYWSRHFAVTEGKFYRLVILNSSAYHGAGPDETDHGRIAVATVSHLRKHLESFPPKPVNVLLCHHHPQPLSEFRNDKDYDGMINGESLLDCLGSGTIGRWIVIHGHKHHPKVTYSSGGGASAIVLSAGSLCVSLYLELRTLVRNQFHLISMPLDEISRSGLVGRIQSWDWATGNGWAPAGRKSGLPFMCGFGFRGDPLLFADRVAQSLKGEKLAWSEFCRIMPEAEYVIPNDMIAIKVELRKKYGIEIQEIDGTPVEIGRTV